jgi:fucose permease
MNLLHGAFPIGTLAAPAGLALAWQYGLGWRTAFLATALATGASLLGFAARRLRWPDLPAAAGIGPAGRRRPSTLGLLRQPQLRSLAAIQALYVGVEVAIAGWLASFLIGALRADEAAGALATAAYWGGFLVGRPVAALATRRFGPRRVLPWLATAGLATAGAGAAAPAALPAAIAYSLTGMAICGIFPTVMALALEGREADAGAAAALIVAAAALGAFIWPWLVGAVAQAAGLRVAMAAAAAPLLAMLALAHGTLTSATEEASPAPRRRQPGRDLGPAPSGAAAAE